MAMPFLTCLSSHCNCSYLISLSLQVFLLEFCHWNHSHLDYLSLQLVFVDGLKLGCRISTDKNVLPLTVKSFRNQGRVWDTFDPAEKNSQQLLNATNAISPFNVKKHFEIANGNNLMLCKRNKGAVSQCQSRPIYKRVKDSMQTAESQMLDAKSERC